jgi:hypothetical protein
VLCRLVWSVHLVELIMERGHHFEPSEIQHGPCQKWQAWVRTLQWYAVCKWLGSLLILHRHFTSAKKGGCSCWQGLLHHFCAICYPSLAVSPSQWSVLARLQRPSYILSLFSWHYRTIMRIFNWVGLQEDFSYLYFDRAVSLLHYFSDWVGLRT